MVVQRLGISGTTVRAIESGEKSVEVQESGRGAGGGGLTLAYREWVLASKGENLPIVVLLHGSPGSASDFGLLAPRLAERELRVIAFDQPGFGASSVRGAKGRIDLSVRANAERLLDALRVMGVERAHVVGWSNGGGAGMWMADKAPERVESLTLIGSIGVQEMEGSGSYWIEHAKYAFGKVLVGFLPELVPHFGLLGTFDGRVGWLRNFSDTDQRELREVMRRVDGRGTQTLILHGAFDMLAPLRVAEVTHREMAGSRMLVLDANHFLPFRQSEQTADAIGAMVRGASGSEGSVLPARGERMDRWEPLRRTGVLSAADWVRPRVRALPWWVHLLGLAACAAWSPVIAVAIAGVAIVGMQGPAIDPFVALLGMLLGVGARCGRRMMLRDASGVDWARRIRARPIVEGWRGGMMHGWRGTAAAGFGAALRMPERRWGRSLVFGATFGLGIVVWACVALIASIIGMAIVEHGITPRAHGVGIAFGWAIYLIAIWKIGWPAVRWPQLMCVRGWKWLRIGCERLIYREYWPTWAWYVMVSPGLIAGALRKRIVLAWLAVNPGIDAGGGWVGESKWEILRGLGDHANVARAGLLRPGTVEERVLACEVIMRERGLGFPVILKPDIGERGYAVKVARSVEDVRGYVASVGTDVIVQEFAAGPMECGVLWVRRLEGPTADGCVGSIFSVTAKEFPVLVGDGVRTLEQLIERHPRFRRQHRTFLERFRDDASRVLEKGEVVRLSMAGNHCQGTLFRDGAHLITPQLTRAIDAIARRYGEAIRKTDSLDFGRFDVRYQSDEKLRMGEEFLIVEMNGTSAESTNIYDPEGRLGWAWQTLVAQWAVLTELGLWRISLGAKRPTLLGLWRIHREAARARAGRGGSRVSD